MTFPLKGKTQSLSRKENHTWVSSSNCDDWRQYWGRERPRDSEMIWRHPREVMDSLGIERNRRKEEQREAHLQSYQCTQRGKASLSEAVSNERLKEMRERLWEFYHNGTFYSILSEQRLRNCLRVLSKFRHVWILSEMELDRRTIGERIKEIPLSYLSPICVIGVFS